jgi:hypothetical protein
MKLEQQVCSLDLAKRLKELGCKQDEREYYWLRAVEDRKEHFILKYNLFAVREPGRVAAFTVAELGEMLPPCIEPEEGTDSWLDIRKLENEVTDGGWRVSYVDAGNEDDEDPDMTAATFAEAMAKMLVYLLENKLIQL